MELHFLTDLLVVFALGGVVVYGLRQVRVPAIVGLLLAGAAMGPHGLSLISDTHRVEVLAEIGVVILLFTIGLEFSLSQLLRMSRIILGAGGGQVLLCIAAVAAATLFREGGIGKPVFFGFLAALSSTAIVLRLLGERAQLDSVVGRVSLGILLFQDLCIVPLMLITPYLAGKGAGATELLLTLLKATGVVVGVLIAARKLIPPILQRVVRTRSRELFLTLLLVLCLGTAWLTSLAGLSLALGAFLAGLAISESEYSHQAMAEAIPFRDAFGSMFFISIGMLMDVSFLFANLPLVLLVVVVLVAIKAVTCALPVLLLGYPLSLALQVGLGLAQVGEFAFVLSRAGIKMELIDQTEYQVFLSASVLSMILTPVLLYAGNLAKNKLPQTRTAAEHGELETAGEGGGAHGAQLEGHVIIAGYGVNGQNLAHALATTGIAYAILEMNPETVRSARARGEPLHYGDCTRLPVLVNLGIERAKMFVVAISDATSTRQAVSIARTANPNVYILVRTRFVSEIDELIRIGANVVIPEEFETSVEIFARVLHSFDIPRNVILDFVSKVRGDMYEVLRQPHTGRRSLLPVASAFKGIQVESLELRPGSPGVGKTLLELEVRARTGASVLAIRRGADAHPNPDPQQRLEAGDVLMVMGDRAALDAALGLFDPDISVV